MSAPLNAEMLIGTSRNGSSVRVAVTTSLSLRPASGNVMTGTSTDSVATTMPSTISVAKPLSSAPSRYAPGGRPANKNRPAPSVSETLGSPSPAYSVTVTPGSTAAVVSSPTPTIRLDCAPGRRG